MLKSVFAVAVVLLCFPAPVLAQHPCDVQYPTVYREQARTLPSLKVGFCFAPVDTNDVPLTEPFGFAIRINSGPPVDLGVLQPLTAPNAAGEQYYEVQTSALAQGTITVFAYATLAGMSAPSEAITLTLTGTPKKPRNTIIRGD